MSGPTTISSSGEDAITQVIDVQQQSISETGVPFDESYEIDSTVDEIVRGGYERVALQFPDELLQDSVRVYQSLRRQLPPEKELYVLADTTFGSCCVDEVAAQHVDADLVVHYGHTCLSPTARLPAIYVLTKKAVDVDHAAQSLTLAAQEQSSDSVKAVILMYDVAYAHAADALHEALASRSPKPVVLAKIDKGINQHRKGKARATEHEKAFSELKDYDTPPDGVSDLQPDKVEEESSLLPAKGRARLQYERPDGVAIEDCAIFYIGGESLALTNLLLTHAKNQILTYDPVSRQIRLESGRTNKLLMRRYVVVQKAKDADVIGILVGTLGVSAYLPLINRLRELIVSKQKKAYTVSVGKLNPAKLANFLEIECFVLVACPENSLIDSKDFLRPIVTPFELELALTSKDWGNDYVLDFGQLLSNESFGRSAPGNDPDQDGATDDEQPVFSSVTGKYRHPKRFQAADSINDVADLQNKAGALSLRNEQTAVAQVLGSAAGAFLSERSYQGLEPRYGQDAPSVIEQGRAGIARGFENEKSNGS